MRYVIDTRMPWSGILVAISDWAARPIEFYPILRPN